MAEIGAPTHDFFSADLAAKGWIPGVSWGIQAAGGNRQVNETRMSNAPAYWGSVRESRSILDSPSTSSSGLPGATGVSGSMRVPVAPSGPRSSGVYTPEEETLGRILGMAGRLGRQKGDKDPGDIAGRASGGRGRSGGPANNTDNVYSAGRDNIVGSTYAAGVSGNAAVNQGTNYGVMGGANNRVNQMFFKTGDNSPMAVGAQPTATSGPAGAGRAGSVKKRRSAGGTTTTPGTGTTGATPGTGKRAGTKTTTPAPTPAPAPAPTGTTGSPTVATPTTKATPTAAPTPTAATPAVTKATPTQAPTSTVPVAPTAGTPTQSSSGSIPLPSFLRDTKNNTAAPAPTSSPSTDPMPITPAYNTPTSTQNTIKELATSRPADRTTTVMPVTTANPTAQLTTRAGDTVDNQAIDPLIRYGVGQNAGPYTSSFPAVTSGTPRGPGMRERFASIMGNARKGPQQAQTQSDVAPPSGMTRPTEAWPGGALGGGSGVRRDGSFSVGDPLMDAAYAREQSGEPAPEGPYTDQLSAIRPSDTFKKIKSMASRAQRRAGA